MKTLKGKLKKKITYSGLLLIAMLFGNLIMAQSIDPVSLVIAKAIKAIDLKVQRLQNETLVLQVAQQSAEQELSKTKLAEIKDWQQQLSKLYEGYFVELRQVKPVIRTGALVKQLLGLQQEIIVACGHYSKDASVQSQYDALLHNSLEILSTLQMVTGSQLSMKDADRICVLQTLNDAMQHCLESVQSLNRKHLELLTNRAKQRADLDFVKRLHSLP